MPKKKQISFNYPIEKSGIVLEVNFEGTDNEVPFPEMIEPDSTEPYEAELKTIMYNGQNILPILEHLDATDIIWNEAVKVVWSEFSS